jgi:hypothetical protein
MPRTARPLNGSSAGFHGARVKVSSRRSTAILPVGVVMAWSYTPEICAPGSVWMWVALRCRESRASGARFRPDAVSHHFGDW